MNGPLGNTKVHIIIGLLQTDWGDGGTIQYVMSSLTIVSSDFFSYQSFCFYLFYSFSPISFYSEL